MRRVAELSALYRRARLPCRAFSTSPPDKLQSAFSHCVSQLREHDYQNYVWAVQLPKALRPSIIALRAFFLETQLVADHAKSEMLVSMRCKWWQEAVNDAYRGIAVDHPVLIALASVLQDHQLTRYRLQRIVQARMDVSGQGSQPQSMEVLRSQCDASHGQLLRLELEALGDDSPGSARAAHHLGRAVGLLDALQTVPSMAAKGKTRLPADLTRESSTSLSKLAKGEAHPELAGACATLSNEAADELKAARDLTSQVPEQSRPLFLPALYTDLWLERFKTKGHNVFTEDLEDMPCSHVWYQLRLKWAMMRHRY